MKAKLKHLNPDAEPEDIQRYKLKVLLTDAELEEFQAMMLFAVRNAPKISQQHQAKHVLTAINEKLKGF
jgi:hypothetical protein